VIEDDLGEKLKDVFEDIDPEPIAAASIGQVHKAQLDDGRIVAVKVQYPGIAEAIYADMQNMRLGLKLLSVIAPGIDTGAIADEIRERIGEELDYELEATNHQDVARIYKGHPFIHVPDVVTSLSRERVIVTEFVEGERFAAMKDRSQEERNRLGEILCRFYVNGPLRHRLLNGDPHPGNSLFMADGRVSFLDFGFFKRLTDTEVRQIVATDLATYNKDGAALMQQIADMGGLKPNPALEQPFLDAYTAIFGWIFSEEPLKVETSKTAEMMKHYTRLRNSDGFNDLVLPAEHIVLMRSTMLLIGLLGQLQATNAWFDIGREWLLGDEPVTELGRQEAAFFGDRFKVAA
jgi:predicted unusual protein kinase regulating ubiquinone biosynthesis (AarF/ABC1/UbiB family)